MVRHDVGGIVKRLGIAIAFSAAAHYGLHLLEPLAKAYLPPLGQRFFSAPPLEEPRSPYDGLEARLHEAVYAPR